MKYSLSLLCFFCLFILKGQGFERVEFVDEKGRVFYSKKSSSAIEIDAKVDSVLSDWRLKKYITASLDSLINTENKSRYIFYKGMPFSFEAINLDDPSGIAASVGVLNRPSKIEIRDIEKILLSVLKKAENSGYPFAKVRLENVRFNDANISASLKLDLKERFVFDSLIILGSDKVNKNLIQNLLGVKKGTVYDQRLVDNMAIKIKEIPYLKATKNPEFVFKKTKVDTYIYAEPKSANRFNGVIGFLPNPITGETVITGDLDLALLNTLKLGERFKFNWQRVRPEVLDLNASLELPFLVNTPFGLSGSLDIFRQDTSLLEVKSGLGLIYNFGAQDYFKVYFSSFDSDRLENTTQAVDLGGADYNSYGLTVEFTDLDYSFNPRKGYRVNFSVDAGNRTFKAPSEGDSLLSALPETSEIFNLALDASYYLSIGKNGVLHLNLSGASKLNPFLTSNELLRFGGNNSLRGFDEMSLRKTSFLFQNIEYRILTDLNSNIFLFANFAWTEADLFDSYSIDWPYGFGAGANFDTNAGIFSISYALGAQNGNTLQLNQGKIHFGFKSLF
ncbi:MAG: hypothetical protein AAF487_03250 [Bacteroidota bacterium]